MAAEDRFENLGMAAEDRFSGPRCRPGTYSAAVMTTDHLTYHADTIGDRLAVIDDRPGAGVRRLTYAAFNGLANQVANGLAQLDIGVEEHVAWWGQNSLETLVSMHAIRKAAGVSVPIPYRSTADEATFLLDNADVVTLLVEAQYAGLAAELAPVLPKLRHVVVFDGAPHDAVSQIGWDEMLGSDATPATEGATDATRTMIYTSGTTGRPKGAIRRVGGEANQFGALLELFGWPTMDDLTFLTTGPLYHSGPSGFSLRAHIAGGTVVTQHHFDAEDWLRLVDTHTVTATFSAPTPVRRITALPDEVKARYDVSSMRTMIANAAPWTMTLKEAYLRDFPHDSLFEVYGSTELSVCTVLEPADQLRKPGSCGLPAPGVEIALFDDDGNEVTEPGVPGELYARSAGLFETYHKAHDRYEADHRAGFQTVGDIAYRDDDGYVYICDRKGDMIITGGVNVYPAEVENVLDAHPDVAEVAVLGLPDEEWGELVCAVAVPAGDLDPASLQRHAHEHLSGPKCPKRIVLVDELPKTGTGKVLKRQLRDELS